MSVNQLHPGPPADGRTRKPSQAERQLHPGPPADGRTRKPSQAERRSRKSSVYNNPPDIKALPMSEWSRYGLETPPYKVGAEEYETRTRKVSFTSTRQRASSFASSLESEGGPRRPRKISVSSVMSGSGDYHRKQSTTHGWRRSGGSMAYSERGSMAYGDWFPGTRKPSRFANTYKMTSDKPFNSNVVRKTIETELEQYLSGLTYEPSQMGAKAKIISDDVKQMVKLHGYQRYKIICTVTLGQSRGQGFRECSRCLWDTDRDGFVTVSHDNGSLFVIVTVYGVCQE